MPAAQQIVVDKVLTAAPKSRRIDIQTHLMRAAQVRGTSPFRIAAEIVRHRLSRQRLDSQDYFLLGLYRPELSRADRDAFVSEREITQLNAALSAPDRHLVNGILNSKLMTEMLLRGAGFPTATTVAVARARPARLPCEVLVGAEAIEAFLRRDGRLPLFGKPDLSSLGVGAASFVGLEGDILVLGDGTRTPVGKLAQEIARDYPDGYVFQTVLRPHPEVARLIGPAVGTLRVHSLQFADGPAPLYVMLKLPGRNAMVDGALSGSNGAALVDPATGRILRAQLLSDPPGQDMIHGHVTGATLPGALLPDFEAAVALALDAHRLLSQQGVLGSDVILTEDGPVLNEINLRPLAGLVQKARGRGLFDEATKARFREVLALRGVKLPIKGVRI